MSEVKGGKGTNVSKIKWLLLIEQHRAFFHPLKDVWIPGLVGNFLRCLLSRAAMSEECVVCFPVTCAHTHAHTHKHLLSVLDCRSMICSNRVGKGDKD